MKKKMGRPTIGKTLLVFRVPDSLKHFLYEYMKEHNIPTKAEAVRDMMEKIKQKNIDF